MSAELSPEVQQVITSGRVAHLTTLCPDGSPHTTILWVGLDGNDIVVGKMAVSPPLIISTCLERGDARWHSTACSPKPGLRRNALAVVPSFAVALAIVARSDATAVVPSRLASILLEGGAIVSYRPPMTLPTVTISQLWHASNTSDQPHQWLRSCVTRAAAAVV